MNIINSINIKKMSTIYFKNKNIISHLKNTIQKKKNIQVSNKNIYDQKIQKIKKNNISKKTIDQVSLENNLININNSTIYNINEENSNFLNLSELIGHNVLIPGSKITYIKNTNIIYGYFLPKYTTSLLIQIKDQNHHLIFSNLINTQKPGNYTYYWNGEVNNICNLNSGLYELSIQAENENGPFYVQPLVHGIVKSIDYDPNANAYKINLGITGKVDIKDIKRIF
ncbi:FLgD tudor-like domain-containing protein [Buchnera aphidicola]|uniref:Uncharacterized protein n=1 Tax=Buchnera aphidicola (Sarucallis kahawaluokalani) TaxID=1241878 RepID=A0A4D6Y8N7_9GAMM|nr:FLgD tudor-like domain-containing protein [Buchnera aphidicola]QCI26027.1 hypothetical protein D9V78_01185 [Buchnera aphidicola (Sarucallis kahawaluokalani)]